MRSVYLLVAAALLCLGAGVASAQGAEGSYVSAPAVLHNNTHVNDTVDFGFIVCRGAIGNFVWEDLNADGIQDSGEPGIEGATVKLLDASGENITHSTTTDINGTYLFKDLCMGNYTVMVIPPSEDYKPTKANQGSDDAKDSDGETV